MFIGKHEQHILVPLIAEHKVMINPDRPLVIYEIMDINMNRLDIKNPELELTNSTLDVNGKHGNVYLKFNLKSDGEVVGTGEKHGA